MQPEKANNLHQAEQKNKISTGTTGLLHEKIKKTLTFLQSYIRALASLLQHPNSQENKAETETLNLLEKLHTAQEEQSTSPQSSGITETNPLEKALQESLEAEKFESQQKEIDKTIAYLIQQKQNYAHIIHDKKENMRTLRAQHDAELINAQLNHIEQQKNYGFDETYATTKQTGLSAIPAILWTLIIDPTNYTYRSNESVMESEGCIDAYGTINNKFLEQASPTAAEDFIKTVTDMKFLQKQDDIEHVVGIKKCKKSGTKINCQTMQDAYEKALQARNQKPAQTKN